MTSAQVDEAKTGSQKLRRGQVLDNKQRLTAKRGHMPQLEAVAVISCKTGEILDFEITSKYCEKCKRRTKLRYHNRNLESGGKRTKIQMNVVQLRIFSGGIGKAASLIIFQHSVEKLEA